MPDSIGDFVMLNKIQPPGAHGWRIQPITREYADGDAFQRVARRAPFTQHPARMFAYNAADAATLVEALYAASGLTALSVIADGQNYDEILIIDVQNVSVVPLQRHTACFAYDGSISAGGAGGRIVQCVFILGRSNAPE